MAKNVQLPVRYVAAICNCNPLKTAQSHTSALRRVRRRLWLRRRLGLRRFATFALASTVPPALLFTCLSAACPFTLLPSEEGAGFLPVPVSPSCQAFPASPLPSAIPVSLSRQPLPSAIPVSPSCQPFPSALSISSAAAARCAGLMRLHPPFAGRSISALCPLYVRYMSALCPLYVRSMPAQVAQARGWAGTHRRGTAAQRHRAAAGGASRCSGRACRSAAATAAPLQRGCAAGAHEGARQK